MMNNAQEEILSTTGNNNELSNVIEEGNKHPNDIKNVFTVRVVKVTNNSVTLEWNSIPEAEVYEIERHHKVKGWLSVYWTSKCLGVVNNLDENFGYQLRVKALKFDSLCGIYSYLQISPAIVGCTLAAKPTTICLFRAIKKDQQFLVKRILRRRPSLIEYPAPNGYLPLANAIAFSNMYIIDLILSHGASVHVGNPDNKRTPLHLAFYYGRLPVARILLNRKANMEAKDILGLTASHLAVDENQGEILKFALENGANIEARDACGWTLLMRAVIMDSDETILKLLITFGANMENRDLSNLNCQDLARLYGNAKAMEYFKNVIKLQKEKKLKGRTEET